MEKLRVAVVGYGGRGRGLTRGVILKNNMATVTAVCDLYEDRAQQAAEDLAAAGQPRPYVTTDYHEVLTRQDVDAVLVFAAWEAHIPVAIDAMRAGKAAAVEVGGAYTLEQCFDLVRTQEETGQPFMYLENCNYGKRELMVLRMLREGLFGTPVHCEGGYCHDLREEVSGGWKNRHYRLRNYRGRNCENYPSHELGPIMRLLDINRGNRMLSLYSEASAAHGLEEYIRRNKADDEALAGIRFAQGDVVTTTIKCARGETILLTLDTTLPRYYSRRFTCRGTRGMYEEATDSVFLEDRGDSAHDFDWKSQWGNAARYEAEYQHPIWQTYEAEGVRGGHGGMDYLVLRDFLTCLAEGREMPIDVYDAAAMMCITPLSEQSIITHAPVAIPDFTCGKWFERTDPHFAI